MQQKASPPISAPATRRSTTTGWRRGATDPVGVRMMTAYPENWMPDPGTLPEQRRVRSRLACALVAWLLPTFAVAQSFDCGQARDAVERAICGSSHLRQL